MKLTHPQYWSAVLAGGLIAFGFPSLHLFPLIWAGLILLFAFAFSLGVKACFIRFFLAGFAFHLIVLQWLMANIFWAGGVAVLGYAVLCAYLALYWGVFGVIWRRLRDRLCWIPLALASGVLWVAMEFLQSVVFTGFGWSALGYAIGPDLPLLQMASFGGVGLVSGIIVTSAFLIAQAIHHPHGRLAYIGWPALLLLGVHGVGLLLLQPADYESKPFQVGLYQSNYAQEMKWDDEYAVDMVERAVQWSEPMAWQNQVDLFVWPEALITVPSDTPPIDAILRGFAERTQTPLFTGSTRQDLDADNWTNSASLYGLESEELGYYDKIHLAPFGEYMPLSQYLPFLAGLVPAVGDIQPGKEYKVFTVHGRRFGPLICFEMLFPSMARRLQGGGADFLIVMTNLAWFGDSSIVPQEREICRMRAVETRLPLVHSSNTGYTGVYDPWGRFTSIGPAHMRCRGALPVPAPGPQCAALGPGLFPWAMLVAAVLIFTLANVCPRTYQKLEM